MIPQHPDRKILVTVVVVVRRLIADTGFEEGLRGTLRWYRDNQWWWERVRSGACLGERLGLAAEVR
jgi:dTDP-D-glucose 4,6-dehydratase